MVAKGVTLRGLEVFEALASSGSVAAAAQVTGLSQPAVSQQLRNLEKAVGIDLLDHSRRPMRLTPAGRTFLLRAEAALSELRLATSELTVMDLSHLKTLSIGLIDDFDHDLTPRLATVMAESMTRPRFKLITAPSHEIGAQLRAGELHMAVAASTGEEIEGVTEIPLIEDPFILVAPRGSVPNEANPLESLSHMPFLRYVPEQIIGGLINDKLAQEGLEFDDRFQVSSHLALMAMVSRRIGWALTTPLGYMRAARFHDQISAYPLPFAPFSRTISLFAGTDWSKDVPLDVARTVRGLAQSQMINPALGQLPWLRDQLRILEG